MIRTTIRLIVGMPVQSVAVANKQIMSATPPIQNEHQVHGI
jgi:hypothetical protein